MPAIITHIEPLDSVKLLVGLGAQRLCGIVATLCVVQVIKGWDEGVAQVRAVMALIYCHACCPCGGTNPPSPATQQALV